MNMIKATQVKVNWSESRLFSENTLYDLDSFELLAAQAAASNVGGGYDKTNVEIIFDNNERYSCRLDLGCGGNDRGALDHLKSILAHYKKNQHAPGYQDIQSAIIFLEQIDFSNESLENYLLINASEEKHQKEQEQERQQKISAAKAKADQEKAEREQFRKLFENEIKIPESAKSVIVGTYTSFDEENSDPYSDYYRYKTEKNIILAWSTHTRDLFSEMRKAAKNHPSTAHMADVENSKEHREKYSMGRGYYLTDKDYISCGWSVRKITFYSDDKARHIPVGEIAIPGLVSHTANAAQTEPQESAREVSFNTLEVQTTSHSKTGADLFVVQLSDRIEKEDFKTLCELSKKFNGYYSKYNRDAAIPGFQFHSIREAEQFRAAIAPRQEQKPMFKASRLEQGWRVVITVGGVDFIYEPIDAQNIAQACAAAWELHNKPTPTTPARGKSERARPVSAVKASDSGKRLH